MYVGEDAQRNSTFRNVPLPVIRTPRIDRVEGVG